MPSPSSTVLAALERLEAAHINVGLYNSPVGVTDLATDLRQLEADVRDVLAHLVADGEVIEWQPGAYRSRIGETVRLLRTVRQRFEGQGDDLQSAPPLVEDVRVEFRPRRRPRRTDVEVADAVPAAIDPSLRSAFVKALDFHKISGFQSRAMTEIFTQSSAGNPQNKAFIVAGDTGAGKTEAFLFPILLDIASENAADRRTPGVRAVLMYPRIRLARNQLGRILRYTTRFSKEGAPTITIGIQNGDVPTDARDEKWVRSPDRQRLRVDLVDQCLQPGCAGKYWVNANDSALECGFPVLICDGCHHIIDSLAVTKKALETIAPDLLLITDVSLNQWLTREVYTHLWGLWHGPDVTLPPRYLVLDEIHLYEGLKGAHIARLIRRFLARTRFAFRGWDRPRNPVVIGVSATLHDEQRFLAKIMDVPPGDVQRMAHLHVIKPQPHEFEETEGRERYVFIYPRGLSPTPNNPAYRVNDQTAAIQIVMTVMHNLKRQDDWRGLAFFDSLNDLQQFSMNYSPPADSPRLQGQRRGANERELWRIRTARNRPACGAACAARAQSASLFDCPYFREGDCWVFAKLSGWDRPLHVAPPVYAGSRSDASTYDLIPTSPSLEVGYDDDTIQLVYQHKAPRNAASFIQRRGRAGRNPNDSPVIVTLLWPYRRNDAFYFFRPEALYDPQFDDTPLNAGNFAVQRSHAVLAFFDLLALLRRLDAQGMKDIPDFTRAGNVYYRPSLIQSWTNTTNRHGAPMIVATHRQTKAKIYFSGGALNSVRESDDGTALEVKGWLALQKDLLRGVLSSAWAAIGGQFGAYLSLGGIVSEGFRTHRSFPFSDPPKIIEQFGQLAMHAGKGEGNWMASFRHVDWMLQGQEVSTTIPVQFSTIATQEEDEDEVLLSYGLTELLPGNVSYRLRQGNVAYWTPVPRHGTSTFLYRQVVNEETGEITLDERFAPQFSDIAAHRGSIYGVPRYLNERFPNLKVMRLQRVRAERFSTVITERQQWYYIPDASGREGHTELLGQDDPRPAGAFAVSSRSSARANSIIVPFVVADHRPERLQVHQPLNTLFGAITGYLEEGRAALGYTRAYYEMSIDVKGSAAAESASLTRRFYPPEPRLVNGQPEAVLLGYDVQTQGIHFEVNPTFLAECATAIGDDESLRLRLRRNYILYRMTARAHTFHEFPTRVTALTGLIIDYWLSRVVPSSVRAPRPLERADLPGIVAFRRETRLTEPGADEALQAFLGREDSYLDELNAAVQEAYRDTTAFDKFVASVTLHSLTAILKNQIARLAGVTSSELVAYADLPIMDQVDTSVNPRILIMDTVEGGSGGIAQAFERLDLQEGKGSLAWTLQQELGYCPFGTGEALLREVVRRASPVRLRAVQASGDEPQLRSLLEELQLGNSTGEAYQWLARSLFREVKLGGDAHLPMLPVLLVQELQHLQDALGATTVGGVPRETAIRHAVLYPDCIARPEVERFREALSTATVERAEVSRELELQLLALFEQVCEDGCPVCMSGESDMEHHYLAPMLNSRTVLARLKDVLLASIPRTPDLQRALDLLQEVGVAHVEDDLRELEDELPEKFGLQTVPIIDDLAQVTASYTVVTNPDQFTSARQHHAHNRQFEVPGGPTVRSMSEFVIATQLQASGVEYVYEPELQYRLHNETGTLLPDFYLPQHNVYVEFWGMTTDDYLISRAKKERIYMALGIDVLSIEKDELSQNQYWRKIKARIGLP